ncbi:hypothetical protein BC834DRAFT_972317 [Gloeopeniophorella convolvens]|nr:hypothetical protein BC834DRAFT_972317 [Gloeopeniophorella convolvens]
MPLIKLPELPERLEAFVSDNKRGILVGAAAAAALAAAGIAYYAVAERKALTARLRLDADAAVQADDFARAAALYTRALAAQPRGEQDSSLYTHRAWCYANMQPPRHALVVRDCDAALAMDPLNSMAVLRRTVALQAMREGK